MTIPLPATAPAASTALSPERLAQLRPNVIFLIGRFRAGTTMFWNFFRQFPQYTCYYEPLHDNMPGFLEAQATQMADSSHVGVTDYFTEFRRLDVRQVIGLWRHWFGRSRFFIGAEESAPDLRAYLQYLIDRTPAGSTPVMKFVRADFRVGWLARQFPGALVIHLARNARDHWTSSVGRNSNLDDGQIESHPTFGHYRVYMEQIARDMGLVVEGHPYRLFYLLWKLSHAAMQPYAHAAWYYEEAVQDFPAWAQRHLVESGLCPSIPQVKIHTASVAPQFHSTEWYAAEEAAVNRFLGFTTPTAAAAGPGATTASSTAQLAPVQPAPAAPIVEASSRGAIRALKAQALLRLLTG